MFLPVGHSTDVQHINHDIEFRKRKMDRKKYTVFTVSNSPFTLLAHSFVGLGIVCFSLHNNKEKTERTLANCSFCLSHNNVYNLDKEKLKKKKIFSRIKGRT
jgi:hypothetical protein